MLDLGIGSQSPENALTLTPELIALKKQIKDQNKEIKRLKEEVVLIGVLIVSLGVSLVFFVCTGGTLSVE